MSFAILINFLQSMCWNNLYLYKLNQDMVYRMTLYYLFQDINLKLKIMLINLLLHLSDLLFLLSIYLYMSILFRLSLNFLVPIKFLHHHLYQRHIYNLLYGRGHRYRGSLYFFEKLHHCLSAIFWKFCIFLDFLCWWNQLGFHFLSQKMMQFSGFFHTYLFFQI